MTISRFEPEHLLNLGMGHTHEYANKLADSGLAFTVSRRGAPIACGGLMRQWEGRYVAWAIIHPSAPMLPVHRAAMRILSPAAIRRIEAWVDVDFPQGRRWAELLGFRREARMSAFSPEGTDMDLYALVI